MFNYEECTLNKGFEANTISITVIFTKIHLFFNNKDLFNNKRECFSNIRYLTKGHQLPKTTAFKVLKLH